jgi:hypothetical protein
MDDKREGRPSFKTSDVVKNEVCDVIDGDRRLTVDSNFTDVTSRALSTS